MKTQLLSILRLGYSILANKWKISRIRYELGYYSTVNFILFFGILLSFFLMAGNHKSYCQSPDFVIEPLPEEVNDLSSIASGGGLTVKLTNNFDTNVSGALTYACTTTSSITDSDKFSFISSVSVDPGKNESFRLVLPEKMSPGANYLHMRFGDEKPDLLLKLEIADDGHTIVSIEYIEQAKPFNWGIPILICLMAILTTVIILLLRARWAIHEQAVRPGIKSAASPKELIRDGLLSSALSLLYDNLKSVNNELEEEVLLLQSQLNMCNKNKGLGIIDNDAYFLRVNNITARALQLSEIC